MEMVQKSHDRKVKNPKAIETDKTNKEHSFTVSISLSREPEESVIMKLNVFEEDGTCLAEDNVKEYQHNVGVTQCTKLCNITWFCTMLHQCYVDCYIRTVHVQHLQQETGKRERIIEKIELFPSRRNKSLVIGVYGGNFDTENQLNISAFFGRGVNAISAWLPEATSGEQEKSTEGPI
ncbi:hypothetical protein WN51_14001 [Melipona quadrifasciata]|uniref:Uncharacterized protein n=1 Tax=Melipona quadrifasciata TaxID=166423 RepID=A0A0M9A1E4_9HYME|nr:hypothetical protein WN51_14001 [Melipona quadrifasciata]